MKVSDISLHDIQMFLGKLQNKCKDRDGKLVAQLEFHLEGNEVREFAAMMYAAEYHLRHHEVAHHSRR